MRQITWVALFCVVFGVLPAAHAQIISAEEMVSNCKAVAEARIVGDELMVPTDFDSGRCWGAFVSFNTATHYASYSNKPLFAICYPPEVSVSQEIKIFIAYAQKHPEQYQNNFFQVAVSANKEAFPCSI
jgi:hypothetical protein